MFGLRIDIGAPYKVGHLGLKFKRFKKKWLKPTRSQMNNGYLGPVDVYTTYLDGKPYLVDKKGNVYQGVISEPIKIGKRGPKNTLIPN